MSELWKLPNSWLLTTIDEVCDFHAGFGFPTKMQGNAGQALPFYKVKDVSAAYKAQSMLLLNTDNSLSCDEADVIKAKPVPSGAVVFAKIGEALRLNRRAIVSKPSLIDNNLMGISAPPTRLAIRYLYWYSIATKFDVDARASVVPSIRKSDIGNLPLPLPPLNEQTRIVEKLEELLSDLDAGVAELKAAQKKLMKYRQSLLKAAVEGTLTEQWRASQGVSSPLSPGGTNRQDSRFARITPEGCDAGMQSTIGVGGEGDKTADSAWLTQRARDLRRDQTPMEQSLWQQLRAKRFAGFKFRRQQPIGRYIVDFVCFDRSLVIELDGSQHAEASDNDARRDDWLGEQGFRVLRFWNNEWLTQQDSVLEAIWLALHGAPPLPNPSPTRGEGLKNETGAELLQRILTERRTRWEAKQLAKFKEQGKVPPKDWQSKYPEPVKPDTTDLPELPEGWVWATLSQVGWLDRGKSKHRPRNAPHLYGGPYPFVQTGDIRHSDTFIESVEATYSEEGLAQSRLWPIGTICITIAANIGKTAILAMEACFPDSVVGFLTGTDDISIHYVEYFIRSIQQKLENEAPATAQKNINLEILAKVVIPIPSIQEQNKIVETLNEALVAAKEQNRSIELTLKQSAAQRKNILKAAFSGQLVPQDPNDEPASVLLERIRAERTAQEKAPKSRGRKSKETT
ncbi:MAG: DUF559 domain-containing protein [Methylococcaceae bacterium]|nr:DUF559 domain-containing protein [Methylococcaceae bacterium]